LLGVFLLRSFCIGLAGFGRSRKSKISLELLLEHDLVRPAFARRSTNVSDERQPKLRAGGKPVSTLGSKSEGKLFREHALTPCQILKHACGDGQL
jgi:hypothetical protein